MSPVEDADPGAAHPSAEAVAPPAKAPARSRIARLLIVGVGLAFAAVVLPRVPHDHQVDFRVEDPSTIVGIELAWSHDEGPGDPVQGGSWHFAPGRAPSALSTSVNLPNGRYAVDVVVERLGGRDELRRVIDLASADHITVPLR